MAIKIDDHFMCLDGAVIASAREDGDGRWPDRRAGLLLLARAAEPGGTGWSAEQELADSYTLTDLDQHPVAFAGRAEYPRAGTAFAAYRRPRAQSADARL
jgi:hypothetical protein